MSGSGDDLVRERFGRVASGYVNSQSHAQGGDLEQFASVPGLSLDWSVLDVATGGGHVANRLAPLVGRVVAVDMTVEMLQAAQQFVAAGGSTNVDFHQASAESLPFADDSFDLVTCRIAAHHFSNAARFLKEAARVSRNIVLLQDHVLPEDLEAAGQIDAFETLRDPSHHRAFSASEWLALFADVGLNVVHAEEIVKRHHFHRWAARQECSAETVAELISFVDTAPARVRDWLDPHQWGTSAATFVNHHILIRATVES